MVWRYACGFYIQNLDAFFFFFFFFQIFHIFNLDFFMLQHYESVYVVGTLWVQLLLQFYTIPTETIQMF